MGTRITFEDFRPIIVAMADLICCHGFSTDEDGLLRAHLLGRGFDLSLIRAAENWCDVAQASGSLVDVLSTFASSGSGPRVSNPLERVSVSDEVWRTIEECRNRGILSTDMAERLLEGARAMDTRDWDDEDVRAFILDACVANGLPASKAKMEQALSGDFKLYYC
jgi:hypothetical protein